MSTLHVISAGATRCAECAARRRAGGDLRAGWNLDAAGSDLAVRARAAWLLVEPGGAVSGWSAAELLGASSGPTEAPADVTVPRFRRPLPGLLVHRESLTADELVRRRGITLTSPARTAYDLLRWLDLTEGVAALDAIAHHHPVTADDVRALRSRHLGLPGNPSVEAALRLMDRRADSPMESRIRVALVRAGLPPRVQHPVTVDGRHFLLDLAYPQVMLAVEDDGGHHRGAAQALRDLEREGLITSAGWKIIRFDAATVLGRPALVVARTRALIAARASSRRAA